MEIELNDDNSVIIGIGKIANEPFILVAQERKIITKSNNNVAGIITIKYYLQVSGKLIEL